MTIGGKKMKFLTWYFARFLFLEGRQGREYEAEGGDDHEEAGHNGHHLDNETMM